MSLTIALEAADALVLAADSRVTEGYTLEGPRTQDDSVKLLRLNDDWGVQTYGFSEIGHAGMTAFRQAVSGDAERYRSLSLLLEKGSDVFGRASADWSRDNTKIMRAPRDVGFVLAGYDRDEGELRIFNFQSPDFPPTRVERGCLLAGQWHIAKYFARRLYSKTLSAEKMKELAVFMLSATMTVEKTVGGAIHLAVVAADTGFRWVPDEEVRDLEGKGDTLASALREQLRGALLGDAAPRGPALSGEDVGRAR